MVQFVNGTDETIVLEPGEAVSGDSHHFEYDGTEYRVRLDNLHDGPDDIDEFDGPREFAERDRELRGTPGIGGGDGGDA